MLEDGRSLRVEAFAQTRPQEGRRHTENQDAHVIGRAPVPWVALLDGAGNAQTVAGRAASLLQSWFRDATLGQLLRDQAWAGMARRLDSALLGGAETTLVAAAVVAGQLIGVAVGDSRAYTVAFDGSIRLLTGEASKRRLGSGEIEPFVFKECLRPRDVLVLLSDGAWGPLGSSGIERSVRASLSKHLSETPGVVLDAASRHGRGDDMTAVALRALSN